MAPRDRLPPWHERHRLTNGREVLIRPIRAEDAESLRAGFALLEPAALRNELAGGEAMTEAAAARIARPNPRTDFGLVVTDLEGPGEAVIGALAHVRADPSAQDARFTLLASRFVAGLGLRRYLLTRVAKWARGRGVLTLRGDLTQDPDLLQLAGSLGFQQRASAADPTLVHACLDLATR